MDCTIQINVKEKEMLKHNFSLLAEINSDFHLPNK